jgi:dCTP deaminase
MALVDWQISERCLGPMPLVVPFHPELVNPASIDVRLGPTLLIESAASPNWVRLDISSCTPEDPYLLVPGQFVLAETVETFNIPNDLTAVFKLKSSRAREGLDHAHAAFADPGWHGSKLTMELKNNRQLHPVKLWPGKRVGQMIFTRNEDDARPNRSYAQTGHYNNCPSVAPSYDA